jgi:hypothetical protein
MSSSFSFFLADCLSGFRDFRGNIELNSRFSNARECSFCSQKDSEYDPLFLIWDWLSSSAE